MKVKDEGGEADSSGASGMGWDVEAEGGFILF